MFVLFKYYRKEFLRAGRASDGSLIPGRGESVFPVASVSRPAVGPTQTPVECVWEVVSPRPKDIRGVTLTNHPHLVPR
jgi:hypothetical protein